MEPTPAEVFADPIVSDWLKRALETALMRDPVDAEHDAGLLARILRGRAKRLLGLVPGSDT